MLGFSNCACVQGSKTKASGLRPVTAAFGRIPADGELLYHRGDRSEHLFANERSRPRLIPA